MNFDFLTEVREVENDYVIDRWIPLTIELLITEKIVTTLLCDRLWKINELITKLASHMINEQKQKTDFLNYSSRTVILKKISERVFTRPFGEELRIIDCGFTSNVRSLRCPR